MKTKNYKKLSFIKCIRTAIELDPIALLSIFCEAIFLSIRNNLMIIVTSVVLKIAVNKEFNYRVSMSVIISLLLLLVVWICEAVSRKVKEVRVQVCDRKFRLKMNIKTMEMDYQLLESPATIKLRERIQIDNNWGCGFLHIFYLLEWLLQSILGLIISLCCLLPLISNIISRGYYYITCFALLLCFVAILFGIIRNKFVKYNLEMMNEMTETPNYQWDFVMHIPFVFGRSIRLFGNSGVFEPYFEHSLKENTIVASKMNKIGIIMGIFSGLGKSTGQIGAYVIFVIIGLVGISSKVDVLFRCSGFLYNFLYNLNWLVCICSEINGIADRQQSTIQYIEMKDILPKGEEKIEIDCHDKYCFEFCNVSFKYPGSNLYVLKNISIKFDSTEKIALVGKNGSGKTTFVKLLIRLYDPTEGCILLNGKDIREYDYDNYIDIFSVIFQDYTIFSFKLGENIAANINYSAKEIKDCIEKIGGLQEMDLNTYLNKDFESTGINISGGEGQKIAIARALYKNSPFIILDEPTAALDPITEYEIFNKFNSVINDRGAIYISHRLSACKLSDRILVFDNGNVIQEGNHSKLKNEFGLYSEMWKTQSQYYESK